MNKKELKEQFSKDFVKVKSALLEVISTSRRVSNDIAINLAQEDFSSIEEYGILTKNIIDASKQFNDLYTQAPKILGSIDKEVREEKVKINLEELMKDDNEEVSESSD
jgi:predicted HTH domain antitoxin